MTQHILVPYDGSAAADQAIEMAAGLAAPAGIVVTVLTAYPILYRDWWVAHHPSLAVEFDEEGARRLAEEAVRRLRDASVDAVARVVAGEAADVILNAAHETKPDLIVMGCRGRSKLSEWVFGNVAVKVLHHAPCSVLVAR